MDDRGSSADEINSQLMSTLHSEAFEAHFTEDYDFIGNLIRKYQKKRQVWIETQSVADH